MFKNNPIPHSVLLNTGEKLLAIQQIIDKLQSKNAKFFEVTILDFLLILDDLKIEFTRL